MSIKNNAKTITILKKETVDGKTVYKKVDPSKINPKILRELAKKAKEEANSNDLAKTRILDNLTKNKLTIKATNLRIGAEELEEIASQRESVAKKTGLIPSKPRIAPKRPTGLNPSKPMIAPKKPTGLIHGNIKLKPQLRELLLKNKQLLSGQSNLLNKIVKNASLTKEELSLIEKLTVSKEREPITANITSGKNQTTESSAPVELNKKVVFAGRNANVASQKEVSDGKEEYTQQVISEEVPSEYFEAEGKTAITDNVADTSTDKPSLIDRVKENPLPYIIGTVAITGGTVLTVRAIRKNKKNKSKK